MKKKFRLRTQLAFFSSVVAAITIILALIITNLAIKTVFTNYINEKQEKRDGYFLSLISIIKSGSTLPDKESLDKITMYAMMDSINVFIYNLNGNLLWKSEYLGHINEFKTLVEHEPYESTGKTRKKIYETADFRLIVESQSIPLSSSDTNFLNKFNFWLVISGIISIIFSFLISYPVSVKITKPINEAVKTSKNIKNGEIDKKISTDSNIFELSEFTETINKLAESLKTQEFLKKQLAADLAHEIRTPLTNIRSHTEAIIEGIWEPTPERFESIREEILRLSGLIEGIEKLNEIEASLITLNLTPIYMHELIRNTVISFQAEAKKKNISIIEETDENILIVCDKDKIKQVLINILSNSIKYTDKNGCIQIRLFKENDYFILSIKDNGKGIDEKHLPFIFERLYRADSSRTRTTGGNGIGLSIVSAIIKQHNWEIKVKSIPDAGTEFIIKIKALV